MKNVLVIAYYFPPMGGSGVQRPLKFVKYLREFGWNPIVLCPEPGAYHTFDTSLQNELNAMDIEIHRVKGNTPLHCMDNKKIILPRWLENQFRKVSTFFWFPDNKKGWIKPGYEKALEVIRGKKIESIFASAPPYSNLILAKKIKEEYKIPLVLDFRDDWAGSHLIHYPTKWHERVTKKMESETLCKAEKIVTVNDFIVRSLFKRNPEIGKRIETVTHGYDESDFETDSIKANSEKLSLLYSGTFYSESGPEFFLKAVRFFLDEYPERRKQIELQFQGRLKKEYKSLIKELGLETMVNDFGYMDHSKAVINLQNADVLWLNNGHKKNPEIITLGKTYEYMATKKPILALIPNGDTKEKLTQYEAAFFSDPENIESIKSGLVTIFEKWDKNEFPQANSDFVEKFTHKNLSKELASIFNVISIEKNTSF